MTQYSMTLSAGLLPGCYGTWMDQSPFVFSLESGSWVCSPQREQTSANVYWALSTSCKDGMAWGLWRSQAIVNAILASETACKHGSKTRHTLPDGWQFEAFVVMVKWAVWKIIIRTLQRWDRILWAGKPPWKKWRLSQALKGCCRKSPDFQQRRLSF